MQYRTLHHLQKLGHHRYYLLVFPSWSRQAASTALALPWSQGHHRVGGVRSPSPRRVFASLAQVSVPEQVPFEALRRCPGLQSSSLISYLLEANYKNRQCRSCLPSSEQLLRHRLCLSSCQRSLYRCCCHLVAPPRTSDSSRSIASSAYSALSSHFLALWSMLCRSSPCYQWSALILHWPSLAAFWVDCFAPPPAPTFFWAEH